MHIEIVDCSKEHIPQLLELENRCFTDPWSEYALASQLPDEYHSFIAATNGERIIGYVCMTHIFEDGDISNVAVDPDYRRMGIADMLIDEMLRRAGEKGVETVSLEVRESNLAAIALYKKQGFLVSGKRKNYYDKPKEDALLMTKTMK